MDQAIQNKWIVPHQGQSEPIRERDYRSQTPDPKPTNGERHPKKSGADTRKAPTSVKRQIVVELSAKYSISALCKYLNLSRSSIYYKIKPKKEEPNLEEAIVDCFYKSHQVYGARKIKACLNRQGVIVSRRKIRRIMAKLGLESIYTKQQKPKYRRATCNEEPVPNLLDRRFDRRTTMDVVVSDLTYISVAGKWHYLCLLVDLWNREIIGWSVGKHKDANLVKQAFTRVSYPLTAIRLFHTDRGSEFQNATLNGILEGFGIKRSLSTKGTPLDNAVIESTNHIVKTEFVSQCRFATLEELELGMFDYVNWYNNCRLHGTIGYMTPIAYRRKHLNAREKIV